MAKGPCQSNPAMLWCGMTLEDRIAAALGPFKTEQKRMFGGLCFMLNGNMLVGTFRNGFMARIAKQDHAAAMGRPGASAMVMKDRVMQGFILIEADAVTSDDDLKSWIDWALAYNATIPLKVTKPTAIRAIKKP
jgi:TfoX/Sxy family transcriptional regulator of competence genes